MSAWGMSEEPRCGCAFSNFRTKQSVLKRKLGAEYAKKEWNVSSAGFKGDLSLSSEKRHNRKVSKYKTETLHTNILAAVSKSIPKPTKTQILSFDSINSEICCKSPQTLRRSFIEENESKSVIPISSKRPCSVFLEVQNIQPSFQKNNLNIDLNPLVELPSEFCKKFKAEILCNGSRQNNKPEVGLTNSAIMQIKPSIGNHKNKCTELRRNIQSNVLSSKSKVNFKTSVKAIPDLQFKTDTALKHVDNTLNASSSCLSGKTVEVTGLKKSSVFAINSVLTSQQINNVQSIHSFTDNNLPNVCKTRKKLPEKAEFYQRTKQQDSQNDSNSLTSDKFSKVFEFSNKLKDDLISKKKLTEENVFQNSFSDQEYNTKPPIALSPKSAQNFKSNLLPKRKDRDEIENIPKRLKVDKCPFLIPTSNVPCKVKKINISTLRPEKELFVPTISQKPSNEFPTNFELASASAGKCQLSKLNIDNESSFLNSASRSEISLVDFSRLLENKSDGSKGSDWMQLLNPTLTEEHNKIDHDEPIKKKMRNILPGGFAEQMQKLQRRENSEKVIWNHKIHRNKRTAQNDSLCLILNSMVCIEEFIIAKASSPLESESQSLDENGGNTGHRNASKDTLDSNTVFILFKRKAFTRLQLKVNDMFRVFQPWQTLHLKSTPHPFILCAYFIDIITSSGPRIINKENITVTGVSEAPPLLKNIANPETATHGDLLFFKRDELVSFSARVQRVWKKELKVKNPTGSSVATKYLRYSVLLQVKEGTFHELRILPDAIPSSWYDVMSQCEGKCYRFHNLCVTHRVNLNKDKYLKDILKTLHLPNESKLEQDFCYQLMFDSSSQCPEEINEIDFPVYCPVAVQPLQQISRASPCDRVTCIAKILLQYKDIFYISDDSLLDCRSIKYIQVMFLMTNEVRSLLKGSIVIIKEALVEEGNLLIDNYSQLIPLVEASPAYQQLSSADQSNVKNQTDVCLKNVIQFLHIFSEVEDIVCVQGRITNVDEVAAFTWLQCSFCLQENLVQDTNLVIYCEDCSRIVPSPVLNVKLEVVIHCPQFHSAKVNVQLLSTTIKRILQVPEGTYQPQCSVCDVLGKEIGPLYCHVKSRDTTSDNPVFHLSEVHSS